MNRKECLEEAIRITTHDRQDDYGKPEDVFMTIASYWNTYLASKDVNSCLEAYDVAAMMILLKIARLVNSPYKEDTWVDIAGYAANGIEVAEDASKYKVIEEEDELQRTDKETRRV